MSSFQDLLFGLVANGMELRISDSWLLKQGPAIRIRVSKGCTNVERIIFLDDFIASPLDNDEHLKYAIMDLVKILKKETNEHV